jgi:hypothetical protein
MFNQKKPQQAVTLVMILILMSMHTHWHYDDNAYEVRKPERSLTLVVR